MRTYRIIIVENDEDEQYFMKEGFNTAGLFEIVGMMINGNALFQWLEEHPDKLPDIVLSDLNMPGKNGYDIIEEMKSDSRYAHIPVIITSTSSTRTIIDDCLALGAASYMVKPETFIEYEPFVAKLYELIETKHLVSG